MSQNSKIGPSFHVIKCKTKSPKRYCFFLHKMTKIIDLRQAFNGNNVSNTQREIQFNI